MRVYCIVPVYAKPQTALQLVVSKALSKSLEMLGGCGDSGVSFCTNVYVAFLISPTGILSVIQWLIALEKNPPPTRSLLTIERLQGWAMLAFYPLESLSYFVSHSILPPSLPSLRSLLCPLSSDKAKRVRIDEAALGLWSTRLWALYVGLQIVHLREDRKLLRARQRALKKAKSKGTSLNIEQEELKKKWDSHHNEWFVNLSYLPLTWHWFVASSL